MATKSDELLARIHRLRERLAPISDGNDPVAGTACGISLAENEAALGQIVRALAPSASQPTSPAADGTTLKTLTATTRRFLQEASELLSTQRQQNEQLQREHHRVYHQGTAALLEQLLKIIQSLPDSAMAQHQAAGGLAAGLEGIRRRVGQLQQALQKQTRWQTRQQNLARRLQDVAACRAVDPAWFTELAHELLEEARQSQPIYWFPPVDSVPSTPPITPLLQRVSSHALHVAQVLARLAPQDYEWAARPTTPVATALLMDVGMLALPEQCLLKPERFTIEDRRLVESHAKQSAIWIRSLFPEAELTALAIEQHHERPDGTGYPRGHKSDEIANLPKLLQVADVYAALRAARPHREAVGSRAALTECLFLAEAGQLDREYAELLTYLTFYPIGTVVELTDGRIAQTIATHAPRLPRAAARPVVAVLTDSYGVPYPQPEYLDLASEVPCSIERSLTWAEQVRFLATVDPSLVA